MRKILIPTDFSENAMNAIKYAIDLFENYNCNFYLLHVNRLESIAGVEASYFPTQDEIEHIGKEAGFIVEGTIDLDTVQYDNQQLLIFYKPE